jgi:hypothetical protein
MNMKVTAPLPVILPSYDLLVLLTTLHEDPYVESISGCLSARHLIQHYFSDHHSLLQHFTCSQNQALHPIGLNTFSVLIQQLW